MAVMQTAEIRMARGRTLRGSRISPPRIGPSSSPENASATVARVVNVAKEVKSGRIVAGEISVAGPNRYHATAPASMTSAAATHIAVAPMFCNHFARPSPSTFSRVAPHRAVRQYVALKPAFPARKSQRSPAMWQNTPAPNSSMEGKKTRFETQ